MAGPRGRYVLFSKDSATTAFSQWYMATNSKEINDALEYPDVAKGVTLQSKHDSGNATAIDLITRNADVDLLIVHGDIAIPNDVVNRLEQNGGFILRLTSGTQPNARIEACVDTLTRLKEASPDEICVLDLMPHSADEAAPWKFDQLQCEFYAENGAKLNRQLQSYGYDPAQIRSREDFQNRVAGLGADKKLVVLIGESSDHGESIRIPGSNVVLRASDLVFPPGVHVVTLICDSSRFVDTLQSASVVGRIFSHQIAGMLRVVLDKRPPDSTREYLDFKAYKVPLTRAVAEAFSRNIAGPESGANAISIVILAGTGGLLTEGLPGNTHHRDRNMWLFFAGVIGGLSREILRWKRLIERKRADKYLQPKYLFLSLAEVACGGAAGYIFAPLVPIGDARLAVAFVAGAGFEFLIRKAAQLQVWTPPVAHGAEPGAVSEDRLLEFLRQ